MRKYDFVRIERLKPEYIERNLGLAERGSVLSVDGDRVKVLFCSAYNAGDFAIAWIKTEDLSVVQVEHSSGFVKLADEFFEYAIAHEKEHQALCPIKFENVDFVEVMVDKPSYLKYGIKKGTRGYIAVSDARNFKTIVDFSGSDGVELPNEFMNLFDIDIRDLKKVDK